jgi:hypothetical protein
MSRKVEMQFMARSRFGPFESPNSPPSAAQTVDIRPFGDPRRAPQEFHEVRSRIIPHYQRI